MNRKLFLPALLLLICVSVVPAARAQQSRSYTVSQGGPFFGVDLGVAEPTNDNFRAHVHTGGSGAPYFGYMFNDWLGIQGHLDYTFFPPDNDHFGFPRQNQWTSVLGYTAGPRIALPLGDLFEIYGMGEGGGFTGLSGSLRHTAPGFSVGGGMNVNLTPNFAVGLFGKWSRAYMSPRPKDLGPGQVFTERFGEDAQWATAGVSMKWSFKQEAAPPPPPPPPPPVAQAPPPPPPPTKEKIVLRAVHFDFNKSNIRPDARPILDEAVRILKERGDIRVVVEGHTDSVGSDAYNMKLSHRRADAVKGYLVAHGIAASRVSTEGFGKRQPVASNATDEGRAQNRRVEIHVQ